MKDKLLNRYFGFFILFFSFLATKHNVIADSEYTTEVAEVRAAALSDCGGDFNEDTGVLYSPNYPHDYPPDNDCYYYIKDTSYYKFVELYVESFNLEDSHNCSKDYLEVYNDETGDYIGKYCGSNISNHLYTHNNAVVLRFHSDSSNESSGFMITFTRKTWTTARPTTPAACGGNYFDYSGHIDSPNYPHKYQPNQDCYYYIQPYLDYPYIQLQIELFSLEDSLNCAHDYLEIYKSKTGDVIGKYCGYNISDNIFIDVNSVGLNFHSDASVESSGFKIDYTRTNSLPTTVPIYPTTTTPSHCGGDFYEHSGYIYSPNYPNNYPPNQNCFYNIYPYGNYYIQLYVESFNLENSSTCSYDYLEIYNYITGDAAGIYCGYYSSKYINLDLQSMILRFYSDGSNEYSGFKIYYSRTNAYPTTTTPAPYTGLSTPANCGGNFYDYSGYIYSPNYPNYYPPNQDCYYNIEPYENYNILLVLDSFDLEDSSNCHRDYLKIYNKTGNVIGTYCGYYSYSIYINIDQNSVALVFHSDGNAEYPGFKIYYSRAYTGRTTPSPYTPTSTPSHCGGDFYEHSGYIQSPNYPNNYPPNQNCYYNIEPYGNYYIQLFLDSFNLEDSSNCSYDYLEIYNQMSGDVFGKYCGSYSSKRINTGLNSVTLLFHSDGSNEYSGFQIYYERALATTTTPAQRTTTPVGPTTPTPIPSDCSVSCNFEEPSTCGWVSGVHPFTLEEWSQTSPVPAPNSGQWYLVNNQYGSYEDLHVVPGCRSGTISFRLFTIQSSARSALQVVLNSGHIVYDHDGASTNNWLSVKQEFYNTEEDHTELIFMSYLISYGDLVALDDICVVCSE